MIVLGIEGTAHTVSCGIIDEGRIYSNCSHTIDGDSGGIHPRDAALHHSEHIIPVIREALTKAGITMKDVGLVAFSMGPGLGPCLRVTATAARSLALRSDIPIIGVNHPLGHVEIGRRLTGSRNPIMLYVSGGNTQVIAHISGRYRVLGETMDIGLGNLLDKLGREMGFPFPGGPKIEQYANLGTTLLELPYSVKGMDVSFSGMLTAAKKYISDRKQLEDICYSVQEYSFSMLVEVLERAMYQTGKREILLAGGVARNQRLRKMLERFAEESGAKFLPTDVEYCMDNGAMIAQAGMLMYENGARQSISDTTVNQRFRIDEVDVPWIEDEPVQPEQFRGAESRISMSDFHGRSVVLKERIRKRYRNRDLDHSLRNIRARNEIIVMTRIAESGCNVPVIYDFNPHGPVTTLGMVPGITLAEFLRKNSRELNISVMKDIGRYVALFHQRGVSHGDLTTANILVGVKNMPYFIDCSFGKADSAPNDMAADIFLFRESLRSLHTDSGELFGAFSDSYSSHYPEYRKIFEEVEKIESRRRYV